MTCTCLESSDGILVEQPLNRMNSNAMTSLRRNGLRWTTRLATIEGGSLYCFQYVVAWMLKIPVYTDRTMRSPLSKAKSGFWAVVWGKGKGVSWHAKVKCFRTISTRRSGQRNYPWQILGRTFVLSWWATVYMRLEVPTTVTPRPLDQNPHVSKCCYRYKNIRCYCWIWRRSQ